MTRRIQLCELRIHPNSAPAPGLVVWDVEANSIISCIRLSDGYTLLGPPCWMKLDNDYLDVEVTNNHE